MPTLEAIRLRSRVTSGSAFPPDWPVRMRGKRRNTLRAREFAAGGSNASLPAGCKDMKFLGNQVAYNQHIRAKTQTESYESYGFGKYLAT